MNDWYVDVDADKPITQGEVIFACPVLFPDPEIDYGHLSDPAHVEFTRENRDVMVMSQGCDLQKATVDFSVILCPLTDLSEIPKEGHLGNLRMNRFERYHLLNKSTAFDLDYRIVDFSVQYVLPYGVLDTWNRTEGKPRLALRSPFLEQMSQRYGNYYSRIGIQDEDRPDMSDITARWKLLHPPE